MTINNKVAIISQLYNSVLTYHVGKDENQIDKLSEFVTWVPLRTIKICKKAHFKLMVMVTEHLNIDIINCGTKKSDSFEVITECL